MKAEMRKRIFSSILAGTMALSIPMTVGATGTRVNQGGATGEGDLPYATGDVFDVILPTNIIRNLDFRLDPNQKIINGQVIGLTSAHIAQYDPRSHVYFYRTDFDGTLAGSNNQLTSDEKDRTYQSLWGNVTNKTGGYTYGNTSSWIVATNKGTQNVVVELNATWRSVGGADGVAIVNTEAELATATVPSLYMELQAATGYTYSENPNFTNVAVGDVGTRLSTAFDRIENGRMRQISLNSLTGGLPVRNEGYTWLSYYIPTVNQNYPVMDASHPEYSVVDASFFTSLANDEYAYYLKAIEVDSNGAPTNVRLWDNRTVMVAGQNVDNDYLKTYDYNVNFYPTYGFRLYGNTNTGSAWENVDVMPTIDLKWRITTARTLTDTPSTTPILSVNNIDVNGATERQYLYINYRGSGTSLNRITWVNGDHEEDLWNGGEIIGGTTDYDGNEAMGPYVIVDERDTAHDTQRVWINNVSIYNWSSNGNFAYYEKVDDPGPGKYADMRRAVTVKFYFDGGYDEPLTLTVEDSRNGLIIPR